HVRNDNDPHSTPLPLRTPPRRTKVAPQGLTQATLCGRKTGASITTPDARSCSSTAAADPFRPAPEVPVLIPSRRTRPASPTVRSRSTGSWHGADLLHD